MNLIIDTNNLVFITRYSKLGQPKSRRQKEKNAELLIFVETLKMIVSLANVFGADGVIMAKDSKRPWRRDMYPEYKGTSTSDEDFYFEETIFAANMLFDFLKEHTSAYCLENPRTEADDIIAIWCQTTTEETTIISSDKDYMQLINDKTKLYSPTQKLFRESDDVGYDLFLKCFRGDKSDNIKSAYPRIREAKIRKAWEDDLELLNLLETVIDGKKVGETFEFNQKLMDLSLQPNNIRQEVLNSITTYKCNKYNQIKVLKFFKNNNLENFSNLFDHKDKAFKACPIFVKD